MSSETTAILAGFGAMLSWGLADFLAKGTIDTIGDLPSLYWGHIFGAVTIVASGLGYLIIAGSAVDLPHGAASWLGLLAFGAGQAVVYLLVYRAFSKGPISLLSPIFASYSGVAALLSVSFGEPVGAATGIVLCVMFFGILLASLEGRASRRGLLAPGVLEALLGAIVAAVWTFAWSRFVHGHGWLSYSIVMYVCMTVVIVVAATAGRVSRTRPAPPVIRALLLIGGSEVCAYLAVGIGFSQTRHVSSVAVISGAFSIPTVLLARAYLGERLSPTRLAGVTAVILAIVILPLVA